MIGRTNTGGGGGGGGLNFRVIGSTIQPTSAKENDVWVNTSTKIESWIFSATEPESPAAGMVWIEVGTSSDVEFNALKKNSITVYPVWVRQYVDGAFADRNAHIFQNGEWVQFSEVITTVYLIQNGYIDLDAHPYSYTYYHYNGTQNGDDTTNRVKLEQTYEGNTALWLAGANGTRYDHKFANVEVPKSATKFVVEYYRLCAYDADPVFAVGDAQISVDRGSAKYVTNGTAEIDVTALRGQTVTFKASNTGASGNDDNYIGNAWFE